MTVKYILKHYGTIVPDLCNFVAAYLTLESTLVLRFCFAQFLWPDKQNSVNVFVYVYVLYVNLMSSMLTCVYFMQTIADN